MAVNVDQQQPEDAEDETYVQKKVTGGDPGIGPRIDLKKKVEEDEANPNKGQDARPLDHKGVNALNDFVNPSIHWRS